MCALTQLGAVGRKFAAPARVLKDVASRIAKLLGSKDPVVEPRPGLNGHEADPPHQAEDVSRIFEPPRGFAPEAIRRGVVIVVLGTLLGVVAGLALGVSRPPTYSASATLQVGQVNPNSPGFFSYVQSASSLATAFSRSIEAAPVLEQVEEKMGLSRRVAGSRLEAAPIPLSPAFRIVASGPSERAAIQLANVSSAAVVSYVGKANDSSPASKALLQEYEKAALQLKEAEAKKASIVSAGASAEQEAEAGADAAQIRLNAIGKAYVGSITSQAPRLGLVSVLAGASTGSSDRASKIELWALLGALGGLVVGCGLSLLREHRRRRRSRKALATGAAATSTDV